MVRSCQVTSEFMMLSTGLSLAVPSLERAGALRQGLQDPGRYRPYFPSTSRILAAMSDGLVTTCTPALVSAAIFLGGAHLATRKDRASVAHNDRRY